MLLSSDILHALGFQKLTIFPLVSRLPALCSGLPCLRASEVALSANFQAPESHPKCLECVKLTVSGVDPKSLDSNLHSYIRQL